MPRFPVLTAETATEEQRAILHRGRPSRDGNPSPWCAAMAHNPSLARAWLDFGEFMLRDSQLPDRDREIITLRAALNCGGEYPWSSHVRFSQQVGVALEEIEGVAEGPDSGKLSEWDRVLVAAADDMHQRNRIGDEAFKALRSRYSLAQIVEVCAVVGRYTMTSYVLNTADVGADGVALGKTS